MRSWRIKLLALALSGSTLGFLLQCDKAALNLQRGFFQGLGFQISSQLVNLNTT